MDKEENCGGWRYCPLGVEIKQHCEVLLPFVFPFSFPFLFLMGLWLLGNPKGFKC